MRTTTTLVLGSVLTVASGAWVTARPSTAQAGVPAPSAKPEPRLEGKLDARADGKLEGKWVMHLYLGERLFDDVVELHRDARGELAGTLTVPGRFTVPVERVQVRGGHWSFQITADEGRGPFHVRYEGDLHAGGDTYVGFATVLDDNSLLGGFVGQRRPTT